MRFLVVDDEPIMLEELTEKIRNIRPGADILGFTKPREALPGWSIRRRMWPFWTSRWAA